MEVIILPTAEQVACYGANVCEALIKTKPTAVLGLATGSTPLALYKEIIKCYRQQHLSFSQITTFNLDEYVGVSASHNQSYHYYMKTQLFDFIDIDPANTHIPHGDAVDVQQEAIRYEQLIHEKGGIDLQLLGIGRNGHIGFNEPTSSLNSITRVKALTNATKADNQRFFRSGEYQPTHAITMGIKTIMQARQVLLLATGTNKAQAVKAMIEGPVCAMCPASCLQLHQYATIVLDQQAASELIMQDYYQFAKQACDTLFTQSGEGYTTSYE
ncbi:glucosamine-6-phosphate deaminase [Spartinivicinus poritis]|uniref:Glucosamine-6-phosphate deaminase n=1 Tax=Spartinivicinus poritis TaxID=2994640 RepID=A0ABT5UJ92_9GAMM|nr:glucosamine-6-phosphate deaminase [Spartinivicinus sp. A2-2]MDE1465119.1 glucosamine-6-phosphate deaminase [Spartinivicinus sp. A2-2]